MTEYPSIDPADVREGDVVRGTANCYDGTTYTVQGVVKGNGAQHGEPACIADYYLVNLTDLRLISRPAPPEPPLRVGDWVRNTPTGNEGQVRLIERFGTVVRCGSFSAAPRFLTRIEPPVGWPVAVPDPEAVGGVRWYYRPPTTDLYYCESGGKGNWKSWPDLLAAGGVPALPPGGAA